MRNKLTLFFAIIPLLLFGQSDFYTFDEDLEELSPFGVSSVSSGRYDPRNRGGSATNCPIKIKKRADLVTLSLTVSSSDRDPEKRLKHLKGAFELIEVKSKANDQILFKSGFVALPMVTGSFFSSKGKYADEVSSFDMILVAKMGPQDSMFDRMEVLNAFIEGIDFGKGVDVYFDSSGIALMNPSQYRKDLLKMIGKEFEFLRNTLGEDIKMKVSGLDQKVRVQQVDDVNLEIFIPYQMEMEIASKD